MGEPNPKNWGGARIIAAPAPGSLAAAVVSPAEIARFAGWRRLDAVKIDVEGHEPEVLRGLFAAGLPRPRHIVVEYKLGWFAYEGLPGGMPDFLRSEGYTVRTVAGGPFDPSAPLPEDNLWASLD
jgi:hypothetical protein